MSAFTNILDYTFAFWTKIDENGTGIMISMTTEASRGENIVFEYRSSYFGYMTTSRVFAMFNINRSPFMGKWQHMAMVRKNAD